MRERCKAPMRQDRLCGMPADHQGQHNSEQALARRKPLAVTATWEWKLANVYGIGVADYYAMWRAQDGLCAICHQPERRRNVKLSVDHNHETGAVRGLLCLGCNTALAWYERVGEVSVTEYLWSEDDE